jgi:hypothetical protein
MRTANWGCCYMHIGGLHENVPTGATRGDLPYKSLLINVDSHVCTQVQIVTVSVEASPTMLDYCTSD